MTKLTKNILKESILFKTKFLQFEIDLLVILYYRRQKYRRFLHISAYIKVGHVLLRTYY